jgi:high affinity Mn2+ porin
VAFGFAAFVLAGSGLADAQVAPPAEHDDTAFDFMNLLSQHGVHDLTNESWNAYGQFNYMTVFKVPFQAPYTDANGSTSSFNGDYERSFAATFSLFFGVKLWSGGALYFAPEMIAERPLSNLKGLGGATEIFELQKVGSETPAPYRARLFVRQTFDLGGRSVAQESNPMQLGTTVESRRLVLTAGNYAALDVFDKNNVTWDPRQTFFNEAFMTHASYDFPADARGYTVGVAAELYFDDWVVRLGRFLPPKNPNEQSIDYRFWERYGDSLEVEHDHVFRGLPGAIRVLGYRNHVFSGRFDDAIAAFEADPGKNAADCPSTGYNYGSRNLSAPDLCWVRRPNVKVGVGINLEQYVAKDIGLFLRAMYSDGRSEVDAYDSADRDLSLGVVAKGSLWRRPFDVVGVGLALSSISGIHAQYLAMGGVDGFIGDGHLRQASEGLIDVFYSVNLLKAIWLAADYQLLWNPGYNADRAGPVQMPGVKIHGEF